MPVVVIHTVLVIGVVAHRSNPPLTELGLPVAPLPRLGHDGSSSSAARVGHGHDIPGTWANESPVPSSSSHQCGRSCSARTRSIAALALLSRSTPASRSAYATSLGLPIVSSVETQATQS